MKQKKKKQRKKKPEEEIERDLGYGVWVCPFLYVCRLLLLAPHFANWTDIEQIMCFVGKLNWSLSLSEIERRLSHTPTHAHTHSAHYNVWWSTMSGIYRYIYIYSGTFIHFHLFRPGQLFCAKNCSFCKVYLVNLLFCFVHNLFATHRHTRTTVRAMCALQRITSAAAVAAAPKQQKQIAKKYEAMMMKTK